MPEPKVYARRLVKGSAIVLMQLKAVTKNDLAEPQEDLLEAS
jgi:hypothetical protein